MCITSSSFFLHQLLMVFILVSNNFVDIFTHEYVFQHKHSYQATISVYIQARSYIYLQNVCLAQQPKSYSINTGTYIRVSLTPHCSFFSFPFRPFTCSCKPWQIPICVVCVLMLCRTPSLSLVGIRFAWNVLRSTGTNSIIWVSTIVQNVGQPSLLVLSCVATCPVLVLMNDILPLQH